MERGNTTHGARVDDELEKEDRAFVQGHPSPGHVEEFRQTEGFPDDTDPEETDVAAGMTGELVDDEIVFETDTPATGTREAERTDAAEPAEALEGGDDGEQ